MIVLLSPAKIQDFRRESFLRETTQPAFQEQAEALVSQVRSMSLSNLADLLHIHAELARLNADRFGAWHLPFTEDNAKPAVMVFNGEVFHGLDVRTMLPEQLDFLQDHLRIFSGLYGLLKPFDLIQPYRLDVGDTFRTERGETLYEYWSDNITTNLNVALDATEGPRVVLNLASGEYIKCLNRKKLNAKIIDVDFLQLQPQGYKTIVIYTKKARGMMTRFVMEHEIEDPEYIEGFDTEGYIYHPGLSKKQKLVFTR
jgi:uncharacterized protein